MSDGASSAQKLPIGQYLDTKVRTRISNLLQVRSGRIPASLHQAADGTNTVWMVNFETDGTYTLPMVKLPVHTNEYTRPPYKQGDKGFVSTADVDTTSMSGLNSGQGAPTYARPANLAALVWHPLGNTTFNDVIDPTAHEQYGGPGGTITHDGTKKTLIKTHPTNGTSISSGGDGSGADGPHKITTSTSGTSIQTPMPHTLQAQNATLDAQGNQSNQGSSMSQGAISSATSMSAPTGNFAGGSMGGLSLLAGLLSGGGSSGSPAVSIDSNAGDVTARTVHAKKYAQLPSYTVADPAPAGLLAALPPTPALAGARVFVTDLTTGTFGTAITSSMGGGTNGRCATCDGTNWRVG